MSVYRFKISFEEHDDVSREIEVLSEQTFENLHYGILESIRFIPDQGASFFMSNDRWSKEQEIALDHVPGKTSESAVLMKEAVLRDYINDPHQKIYYLFDYAAQWTFHVELIRILAAADSAYRYPVCVKSTGDAPKQKAAPPQPKGVKDEEPAGDEETLLADEEALLADEEDNLSDSGSDESTDAYYDESDTDDMNVETFGEGEGDEEEKEFNPDGP